MADLDLNRAEDLMKEKYLQVVRNMSHLELKQFSKADYKKKVTGDMLQLLPNHDTAVLSDNAQCVSNALNREVQTLLSKRTRTSNISETPTSPSLSYTFINELETTMETDTTVNNQTPVTQTVVVDDDYSDNGDYSDNIVIIVIMSVISVTASKLVKIRIVISRRTVMMMLRFV